MTRGIAIAGLLAIATATACEPPRPPIGVTDAELRQPGITCVPGLRFEDGHGCTGETANGSATLRLVQHNDMSPSFVLYGSFYLLDGHLLYNWNAVEGEQVKARTVAFEARVGAGEHVIQAILRYRGHGDGVFSYLKGYRFAVRDRHTFRLEADQVTEVVVSGYEKGGVTMPIEQRPAIRWNSLVLPPGEPAPSAPTLQVPSGSPPG